MDGGTPLILEPQEIRSKSRSSGTRQKIGHYLVNNWQEMAVGAATGFSVKILFAVTAATVTLPAAVIASAMVAAPLARVMVEGLQRVKAGKKIVRRDWVMAAVREANIVSTGITAVKWGANRMTGKGEAKLGKKVLSQLLSAGFFGGVGGALLGHVVPILANFVHEHFFPPLITIQVTPWSSKLVRPAPLPMPLAAPAAPTPP